jgi:hypothetical protein
MTTRATALACLALFVAAAPRADAQGTITDGNATFVLTDFDATPAASFTGVSATLADDHLLQLGWWYRVQGDTAEKFFPAPSLQAYVGDTATLTWIEVDNRGIDAELTYTVVDRGGPSGVVEGRLTISPHFPSPLTIDIFAMADVDLAGSADDSATLITSNNHIHITDPSGNFAQYRGVGADAFMVRPIGATSVGSVLNDTVVTDFDNSGLPFGPGDVTLGFHWRTVTIPAGGTHTYRVALSVNFPLEQFFTISPCRLVDTRDPVGPLGGPALAAQAERSFSIVGGTCGVPATAKAVSVNLAVTGPSVAGNLRLYPAGTATPTVSALNYTAGQTRSNNAIVPLSAGGEIAVYCAQASGTAHFILDVNGYFE